MSGVMVLVHRTPNSLQKRKTHISFRVISIKGNKIMLWTKYDPAFTNSTTELDFFTYAENKVSYILKLLCLLKRYLSY